MTYSRCANPGGAYAGENRRYFTIHKAFECLDARNNYIAQPENNGASAGIAHMAGHHVIATLNFRYYALVPNNDECRVAYCRAFAGGHVQYFDCFQGCWSGQYGYMSVAMNIPSNHGGNPVYMYRVEVTSASLPAVCQNDSPLMTCCLQRIRGVATRHLASQSSAFAHIQKFLVGVARGTIICLCSQSRVETR